MAKKRVYEIAKERGLASKDLLAKLREAGLDVKAAASTVDEKDALAALKGTKKAAQPKAKAPTRKTATKAPAKAVRAAKAAKATKAATTKAAKTAKTTKAAKATKAATKAATKVAKPAGNAKAERDGPAAAPVPPPATAQPNGQGGAPPRPKRTVAAERTGSVPTRRRRVVIDSQASRRQQGGGPPQQQQQRRRRSRGRGAPPPEPSEAPTATAVAAPEAVRVPSGSTVREVAEHLGLQTAEVIKKLMSMGEMATLTQTLSDEAIGVLANEFDREVEVVSMAAEDAELAVVDAEKDLVPRPPVVTIMGHVDHGKTSLLDAIRETEVVAGEAGGITQHIGAYQVHHSDKLVTFLDTPGHEAFTAMRARGAKVTDIAVIVVAADDGVMPQTTEAIDHAKAAGVPSIIAVNKIDKEGAQPDRVRNELAAQSLTPEEWGGETVYCDVSAKTKQGLDHLLDMILLVAEVEELKANKNVSASGTVIESQLDPGRGPVVTVLVQRGTLRMGDALVAGAHAGRVRAMHNFVGTRIDEALPGEPAEVLGFDSGPDAGEAVRVVESDKEARQLAEERGHRLKTEALARRQRAAVSLEDVFERVKEGKTTELNLIVKADVAGSLEAIQDEIAKLPDQDITIHIIHTGIGGISESDVMLAAASGAVIIGFNVRPLAEAKTLADREGVDVRTYTVIYRVTEELRAAMQGMLEPEEVEQSLGMAEVRNLFKASKVGTIAGCHVTQGKIVRSAKARLVRDGTIVNEGRISSLKRFKEDAREVEEGFECGITLEDFQDVKVDDVIEAYETKKVERKLA
ncbi:MAG: translation initiation factor IF-2 [Solirubrobacterales bacterium]